LKWNHAAQLTVALYYGLKFPYAVAFELLREGIKWVTLGIDISRDAEKQQEASIHSWLQTVNTFALKYSNIDDIAALANIFIATYKGEAECDTTRLVTGPLTDPAGREKLLAARALTASI
jgi:hypothetical protein